MGEGLVSVVLWRLGVAGVCVKERRGEKSKDLDFLVRIEMALPVGGAPQEGEWEREEGCCRGKVWGKKCETGHFPKALWTKRRDLAYIYENYIGNVRR